MSIEYLNTIFIKDPKVGREKQTEIYDKLAEKYFDIATEYQYKAPNKVVETLVSLVGDRSRAEISVVDLGCGTGLVGERLHEAGFTNLVGVDPSQGMLDVAKSKRIYKDLLRSYVGKGDDKLPYADNTFDVLTIAGSMGVNMMPSEGCYEMQRLVKPGGYIINILREETVTESEGFKDVLEPLMAQMEKGGKWKLVSKVAIPDYFVNKAGIIFTHQVL